MDINVENLLQISKEKLARLKNGENMRKVALIKNFMKNLTSMHEAHSSREMSGPDVGTTEESETRDDLEEAKPEDNHKDFEEGFNVGLLEVEVETTKKSEAEKEEVGEVLENAENSNQVADEK